jgi:hypothetical protein
VVTFLDANVSQKAAARGAARLGQLVKPDGAFIYQYCYGAADPLKPDYEIHRHFCAGWTLRHVGMNTSDGHSIAQKGSLAIVEGFRTYSAPVADGSACLVFKDKIEISACGLALFAASFLDAEVARDVGPISRQIGQYILNQRTPTGDFVRNYPPPLLGCGFCGSFTPGCRGLSGRGLRH